MVSIVMLTEEVVKAAPAALSGKEHVSEDATGRNPVTNTSVLAETERSLGLTRLLRASG
jgi:hypothetical protein